jgi:phosphoribosylaminoimidazolecarboxamide formyltransferase/IMP cyclohydrolase
VPHPDRYSEIVEALKGGREVDGGLRWRLAVETLTRTGAYGAAVLAANSEDEAPVGVPNLLVGMRRWAELRYGENPHQEAAFYLPEGPAPPAVLKGELSYNNILDVDCAIAQLSEFAGKAAVVVKHVGPCGVAESDTGAAALERAYACDPLSAFGGVVGVNFTLGEGCARILAKKFVECIVAPAFEEAALERLSKKKRTRLVTASGSGVGARMRSALGGMLVQTPDTRLLADGLDIVAGPGPDPDLERDLLFAWKAVKHVRSNAIVFAARRATLGIGAGQPSRVDAVKIAVRKALDHGHDLTGSVMASDGFFPFPDSVEVAAEAGAVAVVQPGGSKRDGEVIDRARELGLTMALTRMRHFRH